MTYRKLVIILSSVLVVAVGITWGYLFSTKPKADTNTKSEVALQLEEAAIEESSQTEESSIYEIPPITLPKKDPQPKKQPEPKNEVERTGQNTGDVSKPEPPPPPEIPQEQKKDPTSKPEYTEEQVKPNQLEPTQPQGGEKNSKGKVYVPGFGWVEPSGEPNKNETVNNDGWEDSPTVGIM